jgi:hypothetical protein
MILQGQPVTQRNSMTMREIRTMTLWSLTMPAFALWPILSTLPAFALLSGPTSALAATAQTGLFVSGFWGTASSAIIAWLLKTDEARHKAKAKRKDRALRLAIYATGWTAVYIAVEMLIA